MILLENVKKNAICAYNWQINEIPSLNSSKYCVSINVIKTEQEEGLRFRIVSAAASNPIYFDEK